MTPDTAKKLAEDLQKELNNPANYTYKESASKSFWITGWICPVCGRGNAPNTSTCMCKPILPIQINSQ